MSKDTRGRRQPHLVRVPYYNFSPIIYIASIPVRMSNFR
jgi:hypothetical protein